MRDATEIHQKNNGRTEKIRELMARYPNSLEETDSGLPVPKHEPSPLSMHCDSDLSHDRVTRRSIGGVVGMIGKKIIIHKSKR